MVVRELLTKFGFKVDTSKLQRMESQVASAKKGLNRLVLGTTAAVAGIGALVGKVASAGDKIAKDSKRLGITAGAYQELSYAAQRSGTDISALTNAMYKNMQYMDEAKRGMGTYVDAFARIGISGEKLQGDLGNLDDQFMMTIKGLSEISNENERVAAAAGIFGNRIAKQIMPLLKEGSKGVEGLRAQFRELGLGMSKEAAQDAETFQDRLLDLKSILAQVGYTIGTVLMPPIIELMENLVEWWSANRDIISQNLVGIANALGAAFMFVVENLDTLVPLVVGLKVALAALSIGLKLVAAGGWAAIAPWLPIVGIVAGITAGLFILYKVVKAIFVAFKKGSKDSEKAGGFVGMLVDYFKKVAGMLKAWWGALLAALKFVVNLVVLYFTFLFNIYKSIAKAIWSVLQPYVQPIVEWVGNLFEKIRVGLAKIPEFLKGLENKVIDFLIDVIFWLEDLPGKVAEKATEIAKTIGKWVQLVIGMVRSFIDPVFDHYIEVWNKVKKGIQTIRKWLGGGDVVVAATEAGKEGATPDAVRKAAHTAGPDAAFVKGMVPTGSTESISKVSSNRLSLAPQLSIQVDASNSGSPEKVAKVVQSGAERALDHMLENALRNYAVREV